MFPFFCLHPAAVLREIGHLHTAVERFTSNPFNDFRRGVFLTQLQAIAKVHAKLAAKMSSWYRDPISSLNHDCLLQIFQYLPFRQIV